MFMHPFNHPQIHLIPLVFILHLIHALPLSSSLLLAITTIFSAIPSTPNTRILSNLYRKIRTHESCFEYQLCLHQMESISADVILLPKTNLLWKDYKVYQETTKHRRNLFTHSCQNTSFSARYYDTPYQPGGTCSILTHGIVGHYHLSMHDASLGQWNIINLKYLQWLSLVHHLLLSNVPYLSPTSWSKNLLHATMVPTLRQWHHKSKSMVSILSQP